MQNTLKRLKNTRQSQPPKPSDHSLLASFPYDNSYVSSIKKALDKYDIGTTFQSNHTLKSLLTHTKTPTPSHIQQNVIYKVPCDDCEAFCIGQTCRLLIKRINTRITTTYELHSSAIRDNLSTEHFFVF